MISSLQRLLSLFCTSTKRLWLFLWRRFVTPRKTFSLETWRSTCATQDARTEHWQAYAPFFESKGYRLWKIGRHSHFPPDDKPRAPDGFSYENEYGANSSHLYSDTWHPFNYPARTRDSRDVLIVLLSDGVVGPNCVDALREMATGKNAGIDRNHTLPMLQEIHHDNLVFGVFPLVGSWFAPQWFPDIEHFLEAASQIMEGVAFLHDHLVVHRDLFTSNFLSSRRNADWDPDKGHDFLRPRYYIIDFEWAIRFLPDSDPETRTVTGPPLPWDIYRRPVPPEMKSELPYCPFKSDVWQLGKAFGKWLEYIDCIPDVVQLLQEMRAVDANERPSAREAVTRLNKLRSELPSHVLHSPIERNCDYDDLV
ncbi:hypothetical protein BDP27DRAFT_1291531 [Rhodocollybia butyracea]|uniref:Protein kinase domain-containing protein n=1 Tax=Rhodocollybia butyracea TaxID=206335 RepID=A0A9P5PY15_9AGAR|nr:hypothetical protein BDP27DRAFT_1291531 [Rhodocollybia butyracea]